ncbi:MAG TPA: hypothetical protein VFE62_27905 [Gemmataceae bacterium]|nr:hypothetical protein [Gemmataceae bacterium]
MNGYQLALVSYFNATERLGRDNLTDVVARNAATANLRLGNIALIQSKNSSNTHDDKLLLDAFVTLTKAELDETAIYQELAGKALEARKHIKAELDVALKDAKSGDDVKIRLRSYAKLCEMLDKIQSQYDTKLNDAAKRTLVCAEAASKLVKERTK